MTGIKGISIDYFLMLELKIYKSPWKAVKLILLSLPFVILSLSDLLHYSNISPAWVDWFGLCFFGLGIPFGLFNLFDNRPELILNQDGIFDRMSYGIFDKRSDKGFIKWDSIKDVYLKVNQTYTPQGIPTSKQKYICILLNDDARHTIKKSKLNETFGLADYNFPLLNLRKFDENKFISLIKLMAHATITERQKLLFNYEQ